MKLHEGSKLKQHHHVCLDAEFKADCKVWLEFLTNINLNKVVGIFTWQDSLADCHIVIQCDNQSVVHMVNNLTSSCKHCMFLIRLLVLNGLLYNR